MRDPVRRVSAAAAGVALLFTILAGPVSAADPAGTHTQAAEAAACATLFSVPVGIGPDPLGACQWDMRAIGATSSGSYAVNRGHGVRVGDIDTGIDLTQPRHHAERRCGGIMRRSCTRIRRRRCRLSR